LKKQKLNPWFLPVVSVREKLIYSALTLVFSSITLFIFLAKSFLRECKPIWDTVCV